MVRASASDWLSKDKVMLIEAWARDGLTQEDIAHNMGVSLSALKSWKKRYKTIEAALKNGKEVADIRVENALYKRAIGYKYKETTQELVFDKESGQSVIKVTKIVEKEVSPDVTAQIYWLKNRLPEKWRDRREMALTNDTDKDTGIVVLAPIKQEESADE